MAFWSSEKLRVVLSSSKVVEPFDDKAVKHGAYELSLGSEAFLTSDDDNKKEVLGEAGQLVIPPGQFGLLLTEERVTIPKNAIGFISIKAGIKFRGLVNVSGFHVDPGFAGRLKFSVYNAGSQKIVLQRKQRVFLLWLGDLDQPTADVYDGTHVNQNEISPDDVMRIQGEIASPGQLKQDIQELEGRLSKEMHNLEHKMDKLRMVLTAVLSVATGLLAFSLRGCIRSSPDEFSPPASTQVTNAVVKQPSSPIK